MKNNNQTKTVFEPSFFTNNRRVLSEKLGGGLVVVTAYDEMQLTADTASSFQQEASFWYLTGINEPGWKLIYDATQDRTTLVKPEISEVARIFNGEADIEAVINKSGAQEVIQLKDFETKLRSSRRKHSMVYSLASEKQDFVLNPAPEKLGHQLERIFAKVIDCAPEIAGLRAIKQDVEVLAIRRAVDLTVGSFKRAKEALADCRYEYELEAEFGYHFRKAGAMHAYEPIVASGINACTLHYVANSSRINKNQPVLCDIGARYDNYNADITRVLVNGRLTKPQQRVYEQLSAAQAKIIKLIQPNLLVAEYIKSSNQILLEALQAAGIIKDAANEESLYKYMPHAISHGLGINVHDPLGKPKAFQTGMVLTVEPGFYLREMGFGFRIEDDVLVTADGVENLSAKLSTDDIII